MTTQGHIDKLTRQIAKLKGMANPLFPKAHDAKLARLIADLKMWQALKAKQDAAASASFAESSGLDSWNAGQTAQAKKFAKLRDDLKTTAAKAAQDMQAAQAAQAAAAADLLSAQNVSSAAVSGLASSPIVVGAAAVFVGSIVFRALRR